MAIGTMLVLYYNAMWRSVGKFSIAHKKWTDKKINKCLTNNNRKSTPNIEMKFKNFPDEYPQIGKDDDHP